MNTTQWWEPHPLDKWNQFFLISVAHSASPPDQQPDESLWWTEVTMPAKDGWQVCFFYDGEDLDYIDHFITPTGEKLEVWPEGGYQGQHYPPVMLWRGCSDTERLRQLANKGGPTP